eukprot:1487342-Prorocentrum_lima.AAC.1
MTSSLVGSEMCIRDSPGRGERKDADTTRIKELLLDGLLFVALCELCRDCLLYTSDAADDM